MIRRFFCLCIVLSFAFAARVNAEEIYSTERFVLDNGLTVVITPMPGSGMAAVYGLVKTGSASEGEYLGSGISHFMEHMLFKGTESRGVGDIPREIQALGGTVNAATNFDFTLYTITVPAVHFESAADILCDMLMHPTFDPQEIETEREVVFNEIRMYHDQPERYLNKLAFETVYRVHPYRLPIIGREDLLKPLTRQDFLAYYRRHYAPNNMVIAVAGGVSSADALSVIQKLFDEYPAGTYSLRALPAEPRQITERVHEVYYPTDLVRVSVLYAGVNVLNPDMAALDVLAIILGQGRGSRLYAAMVGEKKIAHTVWAYNFTPQDPGIFEIRATSAEDHVPVILDEIDRQIERVIRRGVSRDELEKAVNVTLKALFAQFQTPSQIAYRTALDEAITGHNNFLMYYMDQIRAVTSEDISRVAAAYLRPETRSLVVMRPEKMRPVSEPSDGVLKAVGIERVVLENGLTVVLEPDRSLPMVWMNMVFQAGIHEEPADLNGLSRLTAALWNKGSRRYPYEQLTALIEQKGIAFSGFSGQNSFGLQLNALAHDQEISLRILADAVLNPFFSTERFLDEKKRFQIEIIRRHDDIQYPGALALREALFEGHPLGRPQIGTEESIERIARTDVVDFHRRLAVPSNAVLSVSGDFEKDEMLAWIRRYLKGWTGSEISLSNPNIRLVGSTVEKTVHVDKKQAAVLLGVQAENFHDDRRYALEVLGAVIGSPFNGRMFDVIREQQGLAYSLGGGYQASRTSGEVIFQVLTSPGETVRVISALKDIIRDVQENGVPEQELRDVKAYLVGRFERAMEVRDSRSLRVALDEVYGIGYQNYQEYARLIEAVSAEQVQELAQQYLNLDRAVIVTVRPSSGAMAYDGPGDEAGAKEQGGI